MYKQDYWFGLEPFDFPLLVPWRTSPCFSEPLIRITTQYTEERRKSGFPSLADVHQNRGMKNPETTKSNVLK